jgi:hypothetical protein
MFIMGRLCGIIHDILVVVAQKAQRRRGVAQSILKHIRHIRIYKF